MTADEARARHRDLRDRLIAAMLEHVPFDGWSRKSLETGAGDLGLGAADVRRAFPGGPADAADHFADWSDRRMLAELDKMDLDAMKVRARVAACVRVRLELNAPYREAIRRLLSFLALPQNGPLAARMTWRTCDHVWYAAGDRAADFNHYTKRALLAPVYTSTILYWLADSSDGFEDTWGFLDRRIAGVLKIPMYTAKAQQALDRLPSPFGLLKRLRAASRPGTGRAA
ncbi:MAG: COQ9 family protein [Rhodospirillales bacterium CG15_BIG_FIL_POST_REV_8_21_14_020_66_15]|nr:MAG: COQ9 family protein [Rhodospirillales bacterium CG15_BIG_FIL_POST_REV_8_21_14_020_66_15]